MTLRTTVRRAGWLVPALLVATLLIAQSPAPAQPTGATGATPKARVTTAVAFDVSPAMRDVAARYAADPARTAVPDRARAVQRFADRGPSVASSGFSGDAAVQSTSPTASIPAPSVSFEGLRGEDNIPVLGGIPIPPDPVGDVGRKQYVQMVNTVWAVFSKKTGERLLGPLSLASIWEGFENPDCADNSGDPIVLYDQLANRWILTQFTTAGPSFFNCVAVSRTPDATGSYFRYAFTTGTNFPDYPKYGVWPNAYFLSTREFGADDFAGIGAYALERRRMLRGDPTARAVSFLLPPGDTPWITGDGLLPSDLDGRRRPPRGRPNFFVGTQDDEGPYGAPFDAINIFQFFVSWGRSPTAAFFQSAQVPVAEFDTAFPCDPLGSRNCIPQPETPQRIDSLIERQRPIWRLAYRNFGRHEVLVTNQSVEARPGIAGVRWYEIRRPGDHPLVFQQGTFSPADGVNRWMGSIAMDRKGNMALGYSVSSDTVFPGIRVTGRLARDPANEMTLGERVIVNGGGSQTDEAARWGDYTSMNIDPTDDCTFWYVNEYYQTTSDRGWQTRIAAFRLPGCK